MHSKRMCVKIWLPWSFGSRIYGYSELYMEAGRGLGPTPLRSSQPYGSTIKRSMLLSNKAGVIQMPFLLL